MVDRFKAGGVSLIVFGTVLSLLGEVRVKDIVTMDNARGISLIGYGLVIGLNGTGDRSIGNRGTLFTVQSISNMLEKFGITVPAKQLRTRNVAAVMVTGRTPPFSQKGSRFDVTVSSLGDATSLEGGVLLMAPLMDAQGNYYAVAQGAVSIGGFNVVTEAGERFRKNHALAGRIPSGATLEVTPPSLDFDFSQPVKLLLREPDFVTASRIAEEINLSFGGFLAGGRERWLARPVNPGVVEVAIPDTIGTREEAITFIASIETLRIQPDVEARVVINERTGTVVVGGNVIVGEVMISHGNLTIHTRRTPVISQPGPFSRTGQTVVEQITETQAEEGEAKIAVIAESTSVSDLAGALNELGVKPRDIIAIFQAIKEAGALNARLIIM